MIIIYNDDKISDQNPYVFIICLVYECYYVSTCGAYAVAALSSFISFFLRSNSANALM